MTGGGDVRVLIVEDDPAIQRFLRNTLRVQGYDVREATTGGEGLALVRQLKPDIVILDLGLPDMDGMDVIKQVRSFSAVPILVLSSRSDEAGKVMALDMGADDYVGKPFGVDELMARLRTALRHRLAAEGSLPVFTTGGLSVDLTHRNVTVEGKEVKLSRKEYDILRELVVHAGKVLTHRHLLRAAWDGEDVDVQYLRVYIRQIRQKLEKLPDRPTYILTEPGVGYRLQLQD
ncbi:MAG TPA: response regulator transcription factor [Gammaproteobacteria bacterium]|nr:response regulator transcription factor [Gammaproteobacteria bacterium]